MLITDLQIIASAVKGTNLLEQEQRGYRQVTTTTGEQRKPQFVYLYVAGNSIGGNINAVEAPIDLLPGDVVGVEPGEGKPVGVTRGGKIVWMEEETETAGQPKRTKKRDETPHVNA